MLRKKSMLSWNTIPMLARSESSVTSRMSTPSMRIVPRCGSSWRWSSPIAVLLPAPVSPTRATVCPGSAVKLMSARALRWVS